MGGVSGHAQIERPKWDFSRFSCDFRAHFGPILPPSIGFGCSKCLFERMFYERMFYSCLALGWKRLLETFPTRCILRGSIPRLQKRSYLHTCAKTQTCTYRDLLHAQPCVRAYVRGHLHTCASLQVSAPVPATVTCNLQLASNFTHT